MPLNVTVLAFAVKVPLFVQLPLTVKLYEPPIDIANVAPELIVMLLQTPPAEPMLGELGVPEGIVTLVDEIGTVAQPQFDGVFQSVLVVPSHIPDKQVPSYSIPVDAPK